MDVPTSSATALHTANETERHERGRILLENGKEQLRCDLEDRVVEEVGGVPDILAFDHTLDASTPDIFWIRKQILGSVHVPGHRPCELPTLELFVNSLQSVPRPKTSYLNLCDSLAHRGLHSVAMAWDHLSVTKSHLVYIILGGFTSLFMLCSSVIKERMYIGEATVATICGIIFGPHAANLINPFTWGNTDEITLEFSRIVLVVQCFAVGVELPKFYMEKHWKSVVFLLVPVMAFGWLITSVFIFLLIPTLNWLDGLVVAACVTATDPVLASSVVGKGKFARRVPKHLRDLLSAESGCNDGMAFPFVYLALYLIQFKRDPGDVSFHWIVVVILYECVFGAFYGFVVGYIARRGIKWAHELDLIDRESFLAFYFVLGLFCAGSGSILGVDDLLVGFAAGVGFSNDGWFGEKTDESHVSNVIDLLLNLSYFVYLGTIIPWELYNAPELGLTPWRLVVIALFVIFFRRIPIMMVLKPVIPDLKTWREALFAGHFGPIGVGAIFVAILARAELEHQQTIPLEELPTESENENAVLIETVWPIVTFLVISSIIVHGSSIAVFTLGKRINTLTITLSYTKDAGEDGPEWLRRLPRISSQSRSQAKSVSSMEDEMKMPLAPGTLPSNQMGGFLRRKIDDSKPGSRPSSITSKRRKKKPHTWDDGIGPGGPISESAIFPTRRQPPEITISPTSPLSLQDDSETPSPTTPAPAHLKGHDPEKVDLEAQAPTPAESTESRGPSRPPSHVEVFEEGHHLIIEDEDGEVLAVTTSRDERDGPGDDAQDTHGSPIHPIDPLNGSESAWKYRGLKSWFERFVADEKNKRKEKDKHDRKHESARAYQYGNTIIVEDEDGEVVKRYDLQTEDDEEQPASVFVNTSLKYIGMGGLVKGGAASGGDQEAGPSSHSHWANWAGFGGSAPEPDSNRERRPTMAEVEAEDDRHIRFRIGGEEGRGMRKEDFIRTIGQLDPKTRDRALNNSTASETLKEQARQSQRRQSAPMTAVPAASSTSPPAQQARSRRHTQALIAPGGAAPKPELEDSDTTKAGSRSDSPPSPTTGLELEGPVGRGRSGSSASAVVTRRGRSGVVDPSTPAPPAESPAQARRPKATAAFMEEEGGEPEETPAERRRREAALGMMGDHEDDSDDDNTERVLPSQKRGIRWLDAPSRR
ncbi:hypothetical protein MKZ38_006076 [Zalerion maritima]|uniref:Na+/H+ antiporter n=1 Tax=Zalerion maritima TaxID=339359 RepID=A0AAD5WWD2_9PEZI|nr:hypothetical protein MKZ38_006076 [Zalerion maritima]